MGAMRSAARGALGDIRGPALWVVLGGLVCQAGLGFNYVFGALAGDIIGEFGWSRATYSAARAPQLFVIAAASPLVGALTVRVGARRVLVAGTVALGGACLLVGRMQSLWELYLVVGLLGLSVTALGDITVGQLVSQWVDRGRGLALGIVYTGSNLGGWLLVPLAAGIAARESWRAAYTSLGWGALVVILPVALWVVREPRGAERRVDGSQRDPDAALGRDADLDLGVAVRTRSFWILAVSLTTFFFYFLGMLDCLVLFLTDTGMARADAAAAFGHALGLGMVSKVVLGLIADRIPHKAAILADYALLAVSSCVLLALPDGALLWVFVGCFGFAAAARDVVSPLMVASCFGVRYLAQIYGALMLTLLPGGALGPIFAAAVHDRTGSYDLAFAVFAVLNAASVVALCFLRRERLPGPRGYTARRLPETP